MAPNNLPLAVLGGGISGLSTAFHLQRTLHRKGIAKKILLLESADRVGGWINTIRTEGGGPLYELGPRSVRVQGNHSFTSLAMIEELGLEKDLIVVHKSDPAATNRYIATKEKIVKLPSLLIQSCFRTDPFSRSLMSLMKDDLFKEKINLKEYQDNLNRNECLDLDQINALMKSLNTCQLDDITIDQFTRHRFGDEVADYLFDPLCRGISSGNSRSLSIRSMFGSVFNAERDGGSVLKGMLLAGWRDRWQRNKSKPPGLVQRLKQEQATLWNLKNGMSQFPEALESHLKTFASNVTSVDVRKCHHVKSVEFLPDKSVRLNVLNQQDGQESIVNASHLFTTISSSAFASLLDSSSQLTNEHLFKQTLESIPTASVMVVSLEFEGDQLLNDCTGFGFLVPSFIGQAFLGVTFDSICFPAHNQGQKITRLSCMLGGDWYDEIRHYEQDQSALVDHCLRMIRKYLHIDQEPKKVMVTFNKDAIPQYRLGHHLKLRLLDKFISDHRLNLSLIGSSYHGISVNECIGDAQQAVQTYFDTHEDVQ